MALRLRSKVRTETHARTMAAASCVMNKQHGQRTTLSFIVYKQHHVTFVVMELRARSRCSKRDVGRASAMYWADWWCMPHPEAVNVAM